MDTRTLPIYAAGEIAMPYVIDGWDEPSNAATACPFGDKRCPFGAIAYLLRVHYLR